MKLAAKCAECRKDLELTWQEIPPHARVLCRECVRLEKTDPRGRGAVIIGVDVGDGPDVSVTVTKKF